MVDPDPVQDFEEEKKRKKTGCAKKSKHKKDKSDDDSRKHKKHKKKLKKRSRSSSTESSTDERRKHKPKKRKRDKREHKSDSEAKPSTSENPSDDAVMDIPIELMNSKAMVPMTKEEYEKRQSVVRRVYDEESGRHRLIKGDGEVIEEIVSRDRHKQINKCATQSDGAFFQSQLKTK